MRKYWFRMCLLALGCPAGVSTAAEVIATSTPPRAVAATTAPASSSVQPGASTQQYAAGVPAVQLERPRVIRGSNDLPAAGVVPVTYREAVHSAAPFQPPGAVAVTPAVASVPAGNPEASSASGFAVERVALFLPAPHAVTNPSTTPTPLPAPGESIAAPRVASNSGATAAPGVTPAPGAIPGAGVVVDPHGPPVIPTDVYDEPATGSHPFRVYGSLEYLLWWTKDADIPPLATTSTNLNPRRPRLGAPPTDFGAIGDPSTVVLNGQELDQDPRHGGRLRLGWWLPTHKPLAIEGSYFFLNRSGGSFFNGTDGQRVLSRPFSNAIQGFEDVQVVGGPFVGPGAMSIETPSSLQGADVNLLCPLWCHDDCGRSVKIDLFGGGRWVQLHDGLYITETGMRFDTNQTFRIDDRFDTQNNFYGGQLGAVAEAKFGRFSVQARGSLALGVTHQTVGIQGSAIFGNRDGTVQREVGGLLALNSNIGRFSRDRFAIVPEFGLNLGYQVTDWMKVTAGYNFLYWSNVVRPGDQIDRNLDITRIPQFATPLGNGVFRAPNGQIIRQLDSPRPTVPFKDSSFWAQGLNAGIELRY